MGRAPCCEKVGLKRGRWTAEEDAILASYIAQHGEGSWRSLPKHAGLLRCGKSCRLRWINYLRNGLKRGNFSKEEDDLIVKLHATLGNRWSLIASYLPGRTDNEIKNYWKLHLSRQIHTFLRTYTIDNGITITIDIKKLSAAEKQHNGRSLDQTPRINTKKHPMHEPGKSKDNSIQVSATSLASRTLHNDVDRSTMADMEQDPPNTMRVSHTSDGRCSEVDRWHKAMDPMDLTGVLEPNNVVDHIEIHEANNLLNQIGIFKEGSVVEDLMSDNIRRDSGNFGINHDGISKVDGLLDTDWEGFVSHQWDQSAQNDMFQAIELQAVTISRSNELESFVSWLMSDIC